MHQKKIKNQENNNCPFLTFKRINYSHRVLFVINSVIGAHIEQQIFDYHMNYMLTMSEYGSFP